MDEILRDGFKCASALQINFDLLGELIKFNPAAFEALDATLAGRNRLERFAEVLVTHLVDSNVFVRSVALSAERFRAQGAACAGAGGMLGAFMEANAVRLLEDLMCTVTVEYLNQENVCVINTALILLIHASRAGRLAPLLATLRSRAAAASAPGLAAHAAADAFSKEAPSQAAAAGGTLRNFRQLLDFWREYYRVRSKDCSSLEYSSTIPFAEWVKVADVLCGPASSPLSLLYDPAAAVPQASVAAHRLGLADGSRVPSEWALRS